MSKQATSFTRDEKLLGLLRFLTGSSASGPGKCSLPGPGPFASLPVTFSLTEWRAGVKEQKHWGHRLALGIALGPPQESRPTAYLRGCREKRVCRAERNSLAAARGPQSSQRAHSVPFLDSCGDSGRGICHHLGLRHPEGRRGVQPLSLQTGS